MRYAGVLKAGSKDKYVMFCEFEAMLRPVFNTNADMIKMHEYYQKHNGIKFIGKSELPALGKNIIKESLPNKEIKKLDAAVQKELKRFSGIINMSDPLGHPMDRLKAVNILRKLKQKGHYLDKALIRIYLRENGWRAIRAEMLVEMIEQIEERY